MDLQQRLAALATPFQKLGPVEWLTLSTSAGFVVLLALLVVQSRQHSRLKREMAETKPERHPRGEDSVHPHGVLDGTTMSPIDRVFPRRPGPFLMMIATVALGCWLAGYLLAPDVGRFLRSPEWLFQPFYIVAHLVTLRLFINVFTRNYAAGVTHLDVSRTQALRGVRTMLGPIGSLAAALIALPFAVLDFRYLFSNRYTPMGGDGVVRSIDYLMWSIWSVEWFINAFIWVLLLGFLVKNSLTIATHPFRAPIHVVLQDKLYRPFLQMSAQGSTVVLGFSLVTVAYLYYTGGELTDYTGLGITVALLVIGFVPPWLVLRDKVDRAVVSETIALRQGAGLDANGAVLAAIAAPETVGAQAALAGAAGAGAAVEKRLEEALALLRLWHLQHLYGNLGQTEAKAIMVRLLAPAATIGWQVANNYGDLAKRFGAMLGAAGGVK